MIKLTTPLGAVYIRKDAITSINETKMAGQNNAIVNSQVWVMGQAEPFNVLESVQRVYDLLTK